MKIIITLLLAFTVLAVNAQTKTKPVAKDTSSYVLTEPQVILITQLLNYAETTAGNSDKISTRDYNNFHYQVMKIDSVLRVQYTKKHPKDVKKP